MAIVTLTSDFGYADGYVGAVKGVILREAPDATIVDIAHDVPRHDVAHAAWVLASAAFEFPMDTVHVAIVDPGVGGERAEVIVRARGHWFVGPDNGVFAHLGRIDGAWAIEASPDAAPTFHGRDVFAPAAAALLHDVVPTSPVALVGALPWSGDCVVHIDVYGNLITNLAACARVTIAGLTLPVVRTYEDVAPGQVLAYVGSQGTIEIAVRDRDASTVLGVARGEPVWPS